MKAYFAVLSPPKYRKENIKMKKILALALVIVSVLAISIPSLAEEYRPWQYRWGAHTLFPDTFPDPNDPDEEELYYDICNFQSDLNYARTKFEGFRLMASGYYFAPLTVDGQYGDNTTYAVKMVQKYFGLTQDGAAGVQTKDALWEFLEY